MIHSKTPPGEHIAPALSRRAFLQSGAAVGGGLLVSFKLGGVAGAMADGDAIFAPDAFIRITKAGAVSYLNPQVEVGQGVNTALAMLIAEELEVDPATIVAEPAPPDDKLYANPGLGFQATGGSTSIAAFYEPFRTAGAAARVMLTTAAAETWGVEPSTCRAENGVVHHDASNRSAPYGELVEKAISVTAPDPKSITLKDPKAFKVIGKSLRRLDSVAKTTGAQKYAIDFTLPDAKIAVVQASPIIGAKLARMDEGAALSVAGVHKVVRFDDLVAVICDHTFAGKKALQALDAQWDGGRATYSTADLVTVLDAAAGQDGVAAVNDGDFKSAILHAAKTVEARYEDPLRAHATMEPMACTVKIGEEGCDIWVGTQVITRVQAEAARLLGLPPEKVRVHNFVMGGAFGRRLEIDYPMQAVRIAKALGQPIKMIWLREEDFQHDVYRPHYVNRLVAGLDADGAPTAFFNRVAAPSILARWAPQWFQKGVDSDAVDGAAGPYKFPNTRVEYARAEFAEGLTTGWWRGVGVTHNGFVVESFIDELAATAGKDPVEFRRPLLKDNPRALAVLNLAVEKAGWGTPMPAGKGRGVAVIFLFGTYVAEVAEIAIDSDGEVKVERVVCAMDCGRVVNPSGAKAQAEGGVIFGASAALFNQIDLAGGRVVQTNFDTYRCMRIFEAPKIEVHFVNAEAPPSGTGEPPCACVAPAIANAVFAATGKRIRRLPIATGLGA